jgi:hypothetical protein
MMEPMGRERLVRRSLAVALVAAALLLPAAAARANTVTLGSQFQGTIESGVLEGGGTVVNTSLPAPLVAGAPSDGTVTAWRFSGGTTTWIPQIVRPLGGDLYTVAAQGPTQQGTGVGNVIGPFPLSIPVKRGDLIGVSGSNFSNLGVIANPGALSRYFTPPLSPGPGRPADFDNPGFEDAISATLRYCLVPSLNGKKPKAAKQALRAADCTVGTKRKSKKRRKKKKVLSQSVPAGTSISDTAPIDFKVSRRVRSKKR